MGILTERRWRERLDRKIKAVPKAVTAPSEYPSTFAKPQPIQPPVDGDKIVTAEEQE